MALFVAIEGIEGVGKTTLTQCIADFFEQHSKPLITTREPGGTPLAEKIRALLKSPDENIEPMTELLLMFASRAEHIEKHIKPTLKKGISVVSDRYVAASYAYQGGGRYIPNGIIQQLDDIVCKDIQPDYTFLVTAPVELAMQRVLSRNETIDRFEKETVDFFNRVQTVYLNKAKHDPSYIVIDGSQPLEAVIEQFKTVLEDILCKKF